jgi:hypothetical protein
MSSQQFLISISSLFSATVYLWSAVAYEYEDYYKHISPIHVTTILFYFNIFLINIKFNNTKLSKIVNILLITFTSGLIVAGDLYSYFIDESHEDNKVIIIYLLYAVVDGVYGLILIILAYKDYKSSLTNDEHNLSRLFCLQFAYAITTLSQVIPLYMERQIALTNDFVYLFWLLYILDEKTSFRYLSSNVNDNDSEINLSVKKPLLLIIIDKIFVIFFVIATIVSVYLYTIIYVVHNNNNNDTLILVRDIASFTSNFSFYIWSLTSFYHSPQSNNNGSNMEYHAIK